MPHPTQYRSLRRRSSQPITWLILANKKVPENTDKQTQYKSEKVNNLKYSKTKLPWFSCLLQYSARKRGGLILQRSRAHTGQMKQETMGFGMQWHRLGHMQTICTSLRQTTTPTPHPSIFTGRMLFLMPNNSVKAPKGKSTVCYTEMSQ